MRPLVIGILYLLFLAPALYALASVLELVLTMGKRGSNYPAYGLTGGEALIAYIALTVIALWLCAGTVVTVLAFKEKASTHWMWVLPVISLFVVFPAAIAVLLRAGHS